MNKQEAIERIKKLEEYYGFSKGVYLEKRDVINIISKIDEPQKVTVPKFVAEWIEEMKQDKLPHPFPQRIAFFFLATDI